MRNPLDRVYQNRRVYITMTTKADRPQGRFNSPQHVYDENLDSGQTSVQVGVLSTRVVISDTAYATLVLKDRASGVASVR